MCTDGKREELSASFEIPRQSILQSKEPLRAVTISFVKKEGFEPPRKRREGVCLHLQWKMVPKERSLMAKASASHSAFEKSRNH